MILKGGVHDEGVGLTRLYLSNYSLAALTKKKKGREEGE